MVELATPTTIEELRALAGSGRLIAGGTDILVQMRDGRDEPSLIDVSNIADGAPAVVITAGVAELSAMAPISAIVSGLAGRLPAVAASARLFGSLQIRNRATFGGNLANASPAADMVPPLVAAAAHVVVEGPGGSRQVPVAELATGPGRTALGPDEWISLIRVPLPEGEDGFLKLGGRSAMAISIVSLAWRWSRDEDGALRGVRLALGAVAPTVVRAPGAEAALEGRAPSDDVVVAAVEALRGDIAPIDDVRASAWYRREVAGDLLREALET